LLDWSPDSDMSRFDPRRRKYFLSRQTDCYCVAAKVKVANFSGLTFSEIAAAAASRRPHRATSRRFAPGVPAGTSHCPQIRISDVFEFVAVPWRTYCGQFQKH